MYFNEFNQQTLEELREAIERALREGRLFNNPQAQEMMERLQQMSRRAVATSLTRSMVEKLAEEGYINVEGTGPDKHRHGCAMGQKANSGNHRQVGGLSSASKR